MSQTITRRCPITQNDIASLGATRFAVGLSQVLRVSQTQNVYAQSYKIISGGSLEIVPPCLSGSSTSTGNWGVGYLFGSAEVVSVGGPATAYFAATGATVVVGAVLGFTYGATLL